MATTVDSIEKLDDLRKLSQLELIEAITDGLPSALVYELAQRLMITLEEMSGFLRMTPRTLQRRLEGGALDLAESERIWELAHLLFRATEVLESEPAAVLWLKSPLRVLGWRKPIEMARTTIGIRELENILGRIEHGVFS